MFKLILFVVLIASITYLEKWDMVLLVPYQPYYLLLYYFGDDFFQTSVNNIGVLFLDAQEFVISILANLQQLIAYDKQLERALYVTATIASILFIIWVIWRTCKSLLNVNVNINVFVNDRDLQTYQELANRRSPVRGRQPE